MKEKIETLTNLFSNTKSEKQLYTELIAYGRKGGNFPEDALVDENLVEGCQSKLYLTHRVEEGKIYFFIHSESLIAKGLALIFSNLYSGEEPKTLFTTPPTFLNELTVLKKMSMNRQIGISNLLNAMRLRASKYI